MFENYLKSLGMTKKDLSERLGVSTTSVSKWGDNPPRYALAYLELAMKVKTLANSI